MSIKFEPTGTLADAANWRMAFWLVAGRVHAVVRLAAFAS